MSSMIVRLGGPPECPWLFVQTLVIQTVISSAAPSSAP